MNYQFEEHHIPDFSHIQFQYLTIDRLSPKLSSFTRVLVYQFSGVFLPNAQCDEFAQFNWMAALCGYANADYEADAFIMDVSGMEYQGEYLLDNLMGDLRIHYGDEQPQVNVVSPSMRRAVHDRDIDALPGNLEDGLALLETKLLDWERRWEIRETQKEAERFARKRERASPESPKSGQDS